MKILIFVRCVGRTTRESVQSDKVCASDMVSSVIMLRIIKVVVVNLGKDSKLGY